VTGGVAAYKTVQLARDLTRLGAVVDVALTESAQRFVTALSFEAVTGRKTLTDMFSAEGSALHVRLGREADVVCVAPATADLVARAAHGRASDLITTTLLVTRAPVVLCPAMNDRMYAHPQVQANLAHLSDALGYGIVGPAVGPLAVGEGEGPGRMVETSEIVAHIGRALGRDPDWSGRRVLVTAGPTREALDPVRYLGNRSSGRMGYALAAAAWRRGADVTLVSGPSPLEPPIGVELVRVESAREMFAAVEERIGEADIALFAAAVADYRASEARDDKMKRSDTGRELTLSLVANPDIAGDTKPLRREGSVTVGFALETSNLLENAEKKLAAKGFDLLVANDATEEGAGFEVETNRVTILTADAPPEKLPIASKDAVAEEILDRVTGRLTGRGAAAAPGRATAPDRATTRSTHRP